MAGTQRDQTSSDGISLQIEFRLIEAITEKFGGKLFETNNKRDLIFIIVSTLHSHSNTNWEYFSISQV